MTQSNYSLCQSNLGNYVAIQTSDGQIIQGRIESVNDTHVYIIPEDPTVSGQEASRGAGSRFFPAMAIPLAAILGITLIATAPCWGIGCPPPFYGPGYGPYYGGKAPYPGYGPYGGIGKGPYGGVPYGGGVPYAGTAPYPGVAPGAAPYPGVVPGAGGAAPFGWTPS